VHKGTQGWTTIMLGGTLAHPRALACSNAYFEGSANAHTASAPLDAAPCTAGGPQGSGADIDLRLCAACNSTGVQMELYNHRRLEVLAAD